MAAPARDDYKLEMKDEIMGQTPRTEKFSVLYTCGIDEKCSGRKFHRQELEKHVLNSHMPKYYQKLLNYEYPTNDLRIWGMNGTGRNHAASNSRSEVLKDLEWRINYFREDSLLRGMSKAHMEKRVARESGIKVNHSVFAKWEAKVQLVLDTATLSPLFNIAKQTILKRLEENGDLKRTGTGFWHCDPKTSIDEKVGHHQLGISPLVFNKLMDGFDGYDWNV